MSGAAPPVAAPHGIFAARLPPSNLMAEQALLGAMLANNKAYELVSDFLRPDHFADPIHGRIFDAIAGRLESGRMVDAVTLKADFENAGILDDVGGTPYLGKLLASMVGIINAREYGRAIHGCWVRRSLIQIGEQIVNTAFGTGPDDGDAKAQIEAAEQALFDLGERGETDEASAPAHVAMNRAIEQAVAAANRPAGMVGLTTGFRALDEMTGGLQRSNLILLGARPSMGKTTLALGIAAGAAAAGGRVLVVSREMNRDAIGALLAAGLSGLPRDATDFGRIRGRDDVGRFTYAPIGQSHVDRMMAASRAMAARTLVIDECRRGTMAAIRGTARRMKRRGGLDLIIVDYLGLIRVPELANTNNRTLELTRLSADAKDIAVDLDVPMLVLSQLSRDVEKRDDKRPVLPDLRDSGSLEQDADVVAFLYRPHYYLARSEPARLANESGEKFASRMDSWIAAEAAARNRAEVIIAKARRGRIGTRVLRFDDETAWFSDWEQA